MLYELTYRAKDPLVMGLGLAVARDLGSFLRSARADAAGSTQPGISANQVAILEGTSQSGRMILYFPASRLQPGRIGTPVFDVPSPISEAG